MKVLLIDIKGRSAKKCINKDLAGGMGTGTWVGSSLRARLFEYVKKKNVVIPNITAAYLTAILKKAGWEIKLIEIDRETDFASESADLALLASSIVDCGHELEIARILKSRGIYTGIYGAFASAVPKFFEKDVDFVIKGEPEAGILQMIEQKEFPKGIYKTEVVDNLDELPFPDWSQFPVKKYSYSPALNKKPMLTMLSSRGCPYSCSHYCPYPLNSGNKWRSRSVENVLKEMEYLKKNYGIKAIDFRDPVFTLNRKRTLNFAHNLSGKKLDIVWSCETRLDCLDKELIDAMHEAGLRNLNVGIESSDELVLKNSKRLPIERMHQEDIISHCQKLGINMATFYILGQEGDTKESIEKTVAYAKKLNTLVAQFSLCTPYPGTTFYEQLKKDGRLISSNWEDYDEYTPVFRHKFLNPEKLLDLKEKAFSSYYFRPAYILKHMPKYFFQKFLWPF
jgi:anaerobic magnesium-protoporphyrin IX monomethyl ester cyclase